MLRLISIFRSWKDDVRIIVLQLTQFDSIQTKTNMIHLIFAPGHNRDRKCGQRHSRLYIETSKSEPQFKIQKRQPKCPKKMTSVRNPAGFPQVLLAPVLRGHFLRRLPGWTEGKSQGRPPRSPLWHQGGHLHLFKGADYCCFLCVHILNAHLHSCDQENMHGEGETVV